MHERFYGVNKSEILDLLKFKIDGSQTRTTHHMRTETVHYYILNMKFHSSKISPILTSITKKLKLCYFPDAVL